MLPFCRTLLKIHLEKIFSLPRLALISQASCRYIVKSAELTYGRSQTILPHILNIISNYVWCHLKLIQSPSQQAYILSSHHTGHVHSNLSISPASFFKDMQVPQRHLPCCPFCTGYAVQVHLPGYLPWQCLVSMLPVGTRTVKMQCQIHKKNRHLPELTIWSFFYCPCYLPVCNTQFWFFMLFYIRN